MTDTTENGSKIDSLIVMVIIVFKTFLPLKLYTLSNHCAFIASPGTFLGGKEGKVLMVGPNAPHK